MTRFLSTVLLTLMCLSGPGFCHELAPCPINPDEGTAKVIDKEIQQTWQNPGMTNFQERAIMQLDDVNTELGEFQTLSEATKPGMLRRFQYQRNLMQAQIIRLEREETRTHIKMIPQWQNLEIALSHLLLDIKMALRDMNRPDQDFTTETTR